MRYSRKVLSHDARKRLKDAREASKKRRQEAEAARKREVDQELAKKAAQKFQIRRYGAKL